MHCFRTGIHSEKYVVRQFCHHRNIGVLRWLWCHQMTLSYRTTIIYAVQSWPKYLVCNYFNTVRFISVYSKIHWKVVGKFKIFKVSFKLGKMRWKVDIIGSWPLLHFGRIVNNNSLWGESGYVNVIHEMKSCKCYTIDKIIVNILVELFHPRNCLYQW